MSKKKYEGLAKKMNEYLKLIRELRLEEGNYASKIDVWLEDLAGNNIQGKFDRDIQADDLLNLDQKEIILEFTIWIYAYLHLFIPKMVSGSPWSISRNYLIPKVVQGIFVPIGGSLKEYVKK